MCIYIFSLQHIIRHRPECVVPEKEGDNDGDNEGDNVDDQDDNEDGDSDGNSENDTPVAE